jgi:hypothetical protein
MIDGELPCKRLAAKWMAAENVYVHNRNWCHLVSQPFPSRYPYCDFTTQTLLCATHKDQHMHPGRLFRTAELARWAYPG